MAKDKNTDPGITVPIPTNLPETSEASDNASYNNCPNPPNMHANGLSFANAFNPFKTALAENAYYLQLPKSKLALYKNITYHNGIPFFRNRTAHQIVQIAEFERAWAATVVERKRTSKKKERNAATAKKRKVDKTLKIFDTPAVSTITEAAHVDAPAKQLSGDIPPRPKTSELAKLRKIPGITEEQIEVIFAGYTELLNHWKARHAPPKRSAEEEKRQEMIDSMRELEVEKKGGKNGAEKKDGKREGKHGGKKRTAHEIEGETPVAGEQVGGILLLQGSGDLESDGLDFDMDFDTESFCNSFFEALRDEGLMGDYKKLAWESHWTGVRVTTLVAKIDGARKGILLLDVEEKEGQYRDAEAALEHALVAQEAVHAEYLGALKREGRRQGEEVKRRREKLAKIEAMVAEKDDLLQAFRIRVYMIHQTKDERTKMEDATMTDNNTNNGIVPTLEQENVLSAAPIGGYFFVDT
ncbi:hypothetical protein HK097_009869 [Rhizophlyctis rosea]|uniref:Uncharacterized protein n=1 Tax=Rhizophlyctis rosea TaxID=64517 RepID=A0AAD5X474_9FUNG|nr:hypothetical protein HK097_009869 [Rhizophlyctis rosea]